MDLLDLTTFTAVAKAQSITTAARHLHTVQSNVTSRIKGLETEIGTALFSRHSRGMILTEAGQRLLPYADRMLALSQEALAAARDEGDASGELRIGSMETTAAVRLPNILAEFHREAPKVRLSLRTGPTKELVEAVLERRIDAAFVAGPIDHAGIATQPAFDEELVLVSEAAHRNLAEVEHAASGGLTALMFRIGCSYRQRLEECLATMGLPAYSRHELGTLDGILGCVAAGVGITLLPRIVIEQSAHAANLTCHTIPPKLARATTLLIRRRDAYPGRAMAEFIAMLPAHRRKPSSSR